MKIELKSHNMSNKKIVKFINEINPKESETLTSMVDKLSSRQSLSNSILNVSVESHQNLLNKNLEKYKISAIPMHNKQKSPISSNKNLENNKDFSKKSKTKERKFSSNSIISPNHGLDSNFIKMMTPKDKEKTPQNKIGKSNVDNLNDACSNKNNETTENNNIDSVIKEADDEDNSDCSIDSSEFKNPVHYKDITYSKDSRILKPNMKIYDSLSDNENTHFESQDLHDIFFSWNNTFIIVVKHLSLICLIFSLLVHLMYTAFFPRFDSRVEYNQFIFYFFTSVICEGILIIDHILSIFTKKENETSINITLRDLIISNMNIEQFFNTLAILPIHSIYCLSAYLEISVYPEFYTNKLDPLNKNHIVNNFNLSNMRLLRIFGIAKVNSLFVYLINYYNSILWEIYLTIINFFFYNHMISCIWIYVGMQEIYYMKSSWIIFYNLKDHPKFQIYITSLYYNLVTVFTVGYGDISPKSIDEVIYMSFILVFSCIMYSILISSLSTHYNRAEKSSENLQKKRNDWDLFKTEFKISETFNERVLKYLNETSKKISDNKNELLETLPIKLKSDLIHKMYGKTIQMLNLFKETTNEFNSFTLTLLKPLSYDKNELVIQVGSIITDILFIMKGSLKLFVHKKTESKMENTPTNKDNKGMTKFYTLKNGENFGEIYIITKETIDYDIYSSKVNEVNLLTLSHKDLNLLKANYPLLVKQQLAKAYKLYELINERKNSVLNDNGDSKEGFKRRKALALRSTTIKGKDNETTSTNIKQKNSVLSHDEIKKSLSTQAQFEKKATLASNKNKNKTTILVEQFISNKLQKLVDDTNVQEHDSNIDAFMCQTQDIGLKGVIIQDINKLEEKNKLGVVKSSSALYEIKIMEELIKNSEEKPRFSLFSKINEKKFKKGSLKIKMNFEEDTNPNIFSTISGKHDINFKSPEKKKYRKK